MSIHNRQLAISFHANTAVTNGRFTTLIVVMPIGNRQHPLRTGSVRQPVDTGRHGWVTRQVMATFDFEALQGGHDFKFHRQQRVQSR